MLLIQQPILNVIEYSDFFPGPHHYVGICLEARPLMDWMAIIGPSIISLHSIQRKEECLFFALLKKKFSRSPLAYSSHS